MVLSDTFLSTLVPQSMAQPNKKLSHGRDAPKEWEFYKHICNFVLLPACSIRRAHLRIGPPSGTGKAGVPSMIESVGASNKCFISACNTESSLRLFYQRETTK